LHEHPHSHAQPAAVHVLDDPVEHRAAETGAVSSIQSAEIDFPEAVLPELWQPAQLERLAREYWRYLRRVSRGVLRVVYEPDARTVVLLARPLALLRFRPPEFVTGSEAATVTWRIDRGLLVARTGRGTGLLRISVRRANRPAPGVARIGVTAEVQNFYPWLRGSGRLARLGTWLYSRTQLRLHVLITRGFLRSLAQFDPVPEARPEGTAR
jgi:hypothetical protein